MKKLNAILLSAAMCFGTLSAMAQDIPTPPVPTHDANDVLSIAGYYGMADGFKKADYKQGTEQVVDGVMCFTQFYYVKYNFTTVDLTQYEKLHLDVWYDEVSTKPLKVSFYNTTLKKQSAVKNIAANSFTAEAWTGIDLNIADFINANLDLTEVNQLILGDDSKVRTLYVTNVYAYGKKSTAPELGDIVAEVGGRNYTGSADFEAFIGESLSASISARNAEALTAEFTPAIEYTNVDGVISFTVTEDCVATITATLGEETKSATYTFTFVPEPEKEYPVYIGTKGYDTVALALAAAKADYDVSGEAHTITLKQDARIENVMITSPVTIEGATGSEVITIPTTYRLVFKVNNGSLTLRNIIFDGENKTHANTAIVSNDYGLAFEAENVTFRNFTTTFINGLLNLSLNGNKKGTATLKGVKFENCKADTEAGVLVAVNPNLSLSIGDGCENLSVNLPANFQTITYVGEGNLSDLYLNLAVAPMAKTRLMTGSNEAEKISTNLDKKFYGIEAEEGDLFVVTHPVEYAEALTEPVSGFGYMLTAEQGGVYYGMVLNDDKSVGAAAVGVSGGVISLLSVDFLDFTLGGNSESGYTFYTNGCYLICRDGALLVDYSEDPMEMRWSITDNKLCHIATGKYLALEIDEPATPDAAISTMAITPDTDKRFVVTDDEGEGAPTVHVFTTGSAITTGVETVESSDAPVEYYNLQGQRVENPANGLYIRRQGNRAVKVIL